MLAELGSLLVSGLLHVLHQKSVDSVLAVPQLGSLQDTGSTVYCIAVKHPGSFHEGIALHRQSEQWQWQKGSHWLAVGA